MKLWSATGYSKQCEPGPFYPDLLTSEPLLLLISTGNITNIELEKILRANLSGIEAAFASGRFIEITREALVVHE